MRAQNLSIVIIIALCLTLLTVNYLSFTSQIYLCCMPDKLCYANANANANANGTGGRIVPLSNHHYTVEMASYNAPRDE